MNPERTNLERQLDALADHCAEAGLYQAERWQTYAAQAEAEQREWPAFKRDTFGGWSFANALTIMAVEATR